MNLISPFKSLLCSVGLVMLLVLLLLRVSIAQANNEVSSPTVSDQGANSIATQSSNPIYLSAIGNRLFFAATDGVNDYQLWAAEETATGVTRVKAITPYSDIVMSGGVGFFAANEGVHGIELWRTDGTSAGTQLVADLNPGSTGSAPRGFLDVNGSLFFLTPQGDLGGRLWKSDGTAVGTTVVTDRVLPDILAKVNNRLFMVVRIGEYAFQLWVSDGTDIGTIMLKEFTTLNGTSGAREAHIPGPLLFYPQLIEVNGALFFQGGDNLHGVELWKSNGTPEGTVLIKDFTPGPIGGSPSSLTNFQGMLFFTTADGLWKSDGTEAGTQLIKGGLSFSLLQPSDDLLFMTKFDTQDGSQLWRSDGTTNGTFLVKDTNPGGYTDIRTLTTFQGKAFFTTNDGKQDLELWRSDGTATGTVRIKAIARTPFSSNATLFTAVGNRLFFQNYDGQHGTELWSSDGTEVGTGLVVDINQQADLGFASLDTYSLVNTASDSIANIQLVYRNQSPNTRSQVTLTTILSDGLTYRDSSGPAQPTMQGNTLVWQLPDLAPFASDVIDLRIQAPTAPLGTRYPVTLTLSTVTSDAAPVQSVVNVEVIVVAHSYLPVIKQ